MAFTKIDRPREMNDLVEFMPALTSDDVLSRAQSSIPQNGNPICAEDSSNGPWLHPGLELYKIHLLQLTPAERSLVLGENALRLIGRTHRSRQTAVA